MECGNKLENWLSIIAVNFLKLINIYGIRGMLFTNKIGFHVEPTLIKVVRFLDENARLRNYNISQFLIIL